MFVWSHIQYLFVKFKYKLQKKVKDVMPTTTADVFNSAAPVRIS